MPLAVSCNRLVRPTCMPLAILSGELVGTTARELLRARVSRTHCVHVLLAARACLVRLSQGIFAHVNASNIRAHVTLPVLYPRRR